MKTKKLSIVLAALLFLLTACSNNNSPVQNETVTITRTGRKYHKSHCQYVVGKDDTKTVSLSDATATGFTPCSICY